jgi:hypothetical protein
MDHDRQGQWTDYLSISYFHRALVLDDYAHNLQLSPYTAHSQHGDGRSPL